MTKEKKGKRFDINPVTLMAALVSLCALFVSVYQTQLQKKQQYASVWPHLRVYYVTNIDNDHFGWSVHVANNGVGPAVIEEVIYEAEGKVLPSLEAFIEVIKQFPGTEIDGASEDMVQRGEFIPQTVDITMLRTERSKEYFEAFNEKWAKIKPVIRIKYNSVYGEHWEVCSGCPDNTLNQKF